MFQIVGKKELNANVTLMEISAPFIAKKAKAGQFIILRTDEDGERIPLTIAGYDRDAGTVRIIFQTVGATTMKLGAKNEGEYISDFAGPLGKATEIEGMKKMIFYHRSVADNYSLNITYVNSRIVTRASAIYFAYFFKFKTNKNHDMVVSLDRFIKENSPICYQQTQCVTIRKYFKFPIVKIWRKNYNDKSLLIIIYKGICKTLIKFFKLFR